MSYKNANIQQPIPLQAGTGVSQLMSIDSTDGMLYERTVTGDVSVALLPTVLSGTITLHPQSPALAAIAEVYAAYTLSNIIVPGVLIVSSATAGLTYVFENFCFTKPFTGYNFSKVIDDYTYPFACTPPAPQQLTNLLNLAGGVINLG